ncbi:MAG: phenylalanine--tRNA ligase subunit beta [Candidatus Altiarchaeales archaeon]|nr:phenylalanine--tRNA ligase subunit beta [Candidatus Altiarchaeales archaeon]MBD3416783.1 phenylalanine--tRNA ligase subunit beta [Candidatus Altiarchaeales archaeon]
MPSVEFDMGDLSHLMGCPYDLEELRERIPMLGVDMERLDEEKIVLEVFPNRPDLLSVEGFARALRGFLGAEPGMPEYSAVDSDVTLYVDPSVDAVRPAVSTGLVLGVDLDDYTVKSVMDMQEKLHLTHGRNRLKVAIGVHDLDKVEPPFTYKAVDPDSVSFVALDMDEEMTLSEILEKHPKGRDYAWTLEGKSKYPLFVDSRDNVLSFPPIINGELTRLTPNTRNLFLDLTGNDQHAVDVACNIISTSLADRGGKIERVRVERV